MFTKRIIVLLFALFFSIHSFSAMAVPTKASVKDYVTLLSDKVILALKNNENNLEGRQEAFEKIFLDAADVSRIARFVAASAWKQSSEVDQKEYVNVYRKYMAYTYASQITQYSNQALIVKRISDVSQRNILVNTSLVSKDNVDNTMSIVWQLLSDKNQFKLTDLKIENISMALTQRAEFTSFLKKNNNDLKKLILFLQKRLNNT